MLRLLVIVALLSSCLHTSQPEVRFGINPARKGFVPARIALLSCIRWPDVATRIRNHQPINRPEAEITTMCDDFDKYVADGFDNQPYMRGLSPKLTEKLYTSSGLSLPIEGSLATEWKGLATDCQDCKTVPDFYVKSIQDRRPWQIWLANFSKATKGADALMIPILVSMNTRIEDDRGILNSVRSGSIVILLVDTNDGSLLWSGGRKAEVVYKALANSVPRGEMKAPPIEDLKRRLLTDAIWIEFPGRQVYR